MKKFLFFLFIIASACVEVDESAFSQVKKEGGAIYIVDRTGYKWDVTQAVSLGFKPERFQYGIGMNAFTPLDDSLLTEGNSNISESLRVIGISEGRDARAYAVRRLRRHEISNSSLSGKPVAVGY